MKSSPQVSHPASLFVLALLSLTSSACGASDSTDVAVSSAAPALAAEPPAATSDVDIDADAVAAEPPAPAPCSTAAVQQKLSQVIAGVDAQMDVPGYLLAVRTADESWDLQLGSPGLDPLAPYRVASIGKTFTAAAVLRLVEQGRLDLDASVQSAAPEVFASLLRSGGYDPARISVRQLLQHDAGLQDYGLSDAFFEAVMADPGRHWTREEQVQVAMNLGQPLSEPGLEYHYSDTGYVLLGAIIERATGQGLGPALRELLRLDTLGLSSTWLESQERAPQGLRPHAPQLLEGADLFSYDASIDSYGGGGYVSTTRELVLFYEALLSGRIFDDAKTLQTMLSVPSVNAESHYGMGIEVMGTGCWGHNGYWGTIALYCPEQQLGVAVVGMSPDSLGELIGIVKAAASEVMACRDAAPDAQ